MHRAQVATVVLVATLQPIAAQSVDAFRVSRSPIVDARQETLQAIDPETKRTTEVFPGSHQSPYGAMVMRRIEEMLARVDEADRNALVAGNIGAGVDRAITSWRAHPTGLTVALAVHYYRDRLLNLTVNLADDYGRPEPIEPADYQFFTVAVCSRAGAERWTCREELLAAVAKKHNLALPATRGDQAAVVEQLLERVLAEKQL